MSEKQVTEVPVLVVGAGPAGLTTAAALARAGVEVLLVERRPDLSTLPRATAVSTRVMELFRSWGLDEEIRAGGADAEMLLWESPTLARVATGSAIVAGYPTREQSLVVSPTGPACVPQDHVEPVLLRHLTGLGPARVRFGAEVVGLQHRPDGVMAAVRDVQSGESRLVHARYLVAADGAHSRVRRALEIPMRGTDDLAYAATALFRAPLWDVVGDHRYVLYWVTHPEAEGAFLPSGGGDRWHYGYFSEESPTVSEETILRRILIGAGRAGLRPRIERTGTFSFAAKIADSFRRGSTFLVGDAAHRVTPRGGTGMNTAIQSGHDLGWKLAWVLRGWAAAELLDSYEAERRPIAENNVARSADPSGSRREVVRELAVDLGGRIPHVWLPAGAGRVSTLDLVGAGLTLLTGSRGDAWEAAARSVPGPVAVASHHLDEVTARALGITGRGALLVRPDGLPAHLWAEDMEASAELRGAVAAFTGRARRRPVVSAEAA